MIEFDLGKFGWDAIGAISTIFIAAMGFLINSKLNDASKKTERFSILVEFRREISEFSSQFIDLTSKAIALCDSKETEKIRIETGNDIAAQFSAMLDRGRFIFPNYVDGSKFGVEKGPAFEGFRREPLDALLAAYFATLSICDKEKSTRFLEFSLREIFRAGQPLGRKYDSSSAKSLLIEARRSYLNAVVPSTFPREWREQFHNLYGPVKVKKEAEIDGLVHDSVAKSFVSQ